MIISMTGIGRATFEFNGSTYDIEIKSVNSKYLDINIKTPQILLNKDYELSEFIKTKIKRGKIFLTITLSKNSKVLSEFNIDKIKLKNFFNYIKEIKKITRLKDKIKLEHIIYNKELISFVESDLPDDKFDEIKIAIEKAVNDLIKMKKKEGAELEKDIIKRIKIIENKVKEIQSLSNISVNEHFENYKKKALQLIGENSSNLFDDRLKFELALLTEKSDISEECVRLNSHLVLFLDLIKKENEIGRKLNFLCQEIIREANTIASKTLSYEITHKVIEIKEEIERIREQIQNVE